MYTVVWNPRIYEFDSLNNCSISVNVTLQSTDSVTLSRTKTCYHTLLRGIAVLHRLRS